MHSDNHNHGHSHHNGHSHVHTVTSLNAAFIIGISLNLLYVIVEAVFGFVTDSMGLLSDAGHNLSDCAALFLALIAFKLAHRKADARHTYGYRKLTVQASFINAVLLCIAVGAIIVESIEKIIHPAEVDGDTIAWVAGVGIIINGLTAWLLQRHQKNDLNVKGAFLHMLTDTLVAVGVVVAGIVIDITGWYIIDPIIGLVIALFLGLSTKNLLVESFRLSVDQVPSGVDMDQLVDELKNVEGVESLHHLHVWALSTSENAMTLHVVVRVGFDPQAVVERIHHIAAENHIDHSTIETETPAHHCCEAPLFSID